MKRDLWWREENCSGLKLILERLRNPMLDGVCYESNLEFSEDIVSQMVVSNCLKSIVKKPITYTNAFPLRHRALLSEI